MWVISNYDNTPFHTINIYFPPGDIKKAKYYARLFTCLIYYKIYKKISNFKILVTGVFNKIGMEQKKFLENLRL